MSQSKLPKQAPAARHQLLTVYGRKPVLEALQNPQLAPERLHLAQTNRSGGIIAEITSAAQRRQVEVYEHDRIALARISRNGKQDQGVALDVRCPEFRSLDEIALDQLPQASRFLALDGVTNPQNAGMIVRSAAAAGMNGILWPAKGVATLGPLVIKASVGTVFRAPIIHCETLPGALDRCRTHGMTVATLAADAEQSLFDHRAHRPTVYVLGGETDGASREARDRSDITLRIPMANGVESLNVAVTAALVSYATAPPSR